MNLEELNVYLYVQPTNNKVSKARFKIKERSYKCRAPWGLNVLCNAPWGLKVLCIAPWGVKVLCNASWGLKVLYAMHPGA